jgi:hypothetical protein
MSHPRTRSLLLAGAVLAAALAPAAVAGAAPADSAADRAQARHDRIVAYWTPERMRAATPRDFVRQADGSFALATPKGNGNGRGNGGGGKPGGEDPAPDPVFPAEGSSTGDPWAGGPVDQRTGKVFFTSGMWGYVCSGAVVEDGGSARALVLTAAHCVFDNARKGKKPAPGFFENWLFVPDYAPTGFLLDCADTQQACWTAEALMVHRGFADAGGFTATATTYDFAFAVVSSPYDGELDAAPRGSYDLGTSTSADDELAAFGYPADLPYDGLSLTYCEGPIGQDSRNSDETWAMACDMTGGSSGGPWLAGMDLSTGAGGTLNSLNSYGYTGEPYMYGPKFVDATDDLHAAAIAAAKAYTPANGIIG